MRARDVTYALAVIALMVATRGRTAQAQKTAAQVPVQKGAVQTVSPTLLQQAAVVASKAPTVVVPALVGESVTRADSIVRQMSLIPRVVPATRKSGTIARQAPVAGTTVFVKAIVTMYVDTSSTGPTDDVFAIVPNVVGRPWSVAIAMLRQQSLTGYMLPPRPSDPTNATVVDQSVTVGKHVDTGTRVGLTLVRPDPMTTVPSVLGKPVMTTRRAVEEAELKLSEQSAPSANVDSGLVMDQQPGGGTRVARGSPVSVTYSTGLPTVRVPDLGKRTRADAERALADSALRTGPVDTVNSIGGFGRVVWQNPAAGTQVRSGTAVAFHIGRRDPNAAVVVPDLIGLTLDRATVALRPSLSWHLVDSLPSSATPSTIVRQDPVAGDSAKPGSDVHVSIARGVRIVDSTDIPDLTGLTRAEEITRLGTARLTVGQELPVQSGTPERVSGQIPDPGTRDTVGAVVRFAIAPASVRTETRVPRVLALPLDSARRILRLARLVGVPSVERATLEPKHWRVFAQAPAEGTMVAVGSRVGLSVQHAPDSVPVPDVRRTAAERARTIVTTGQLQFAVARRRFAFHLRETVLMQTPPGGQLVPVGNVVTVDLSRPLTWPLTLATLPLVLYGLTKTPLREWVRQSPKVPITFAVHVNALEANRPVVELMPTRDLVTFEVTFDFAFVSSDSTADVSTDSSIIDGDTPHA